MIEQKTFNKQTVIIEYKNLLITEMEKMGASPHEISLVKDATIRNAINRKRKPEDVAWAILQEICQK